MTESAREFFEGMEAKVDGAKTAGMTASYLFDVEGAGRWTVDVVDGAVNVTEGGEDAATTITTGEDSFLKMVNGELNPTTAYMTGKLKIKGDMGAAMKLQQLF